jgi:hypothetical protein
MDKWWEGNSAQNLWMEITRRPDIGSDLKAPIEARGGRSTAGYTLLEDVRAGDIVVHYDSAHEEIVGVSVATGEQYHQPIYWAARGTSARSNAEQPSWKPGLYVALGSYTPLTEPISSATIQQHAREILAISERLSEQHRGSLYFPFNRYRDGVRAYQSYFAKFPRELLTVFPALANVVAGLGSDPLQTVPVMTESEQAQENADEASGKRRRSGGRGKRQGRRVDPVVKAAIEAHAMNAAADYYGSLGRVDDTSATESYDYSVMIDGEEWHVEVKGTSTLGEAVTISPNEVRHAKTFPRVALFILSEIDVEKTENGPLTSGGKVHLFHPWDITEGELVATNYEWRRPR